MFSFRAAVRFRAVLLPLLLVVLSVASIRQAQADGNPTITSTSAGNGFVDLSWDNSVSGAYFYRVYYGVGNTSTPSSPIYNSRTARIDSLTNGTRYMFVVKAYDYNGDLIDQSYPPAYETPTGSGGGGGGENPSQGCVSGRVTLNGHGLDDIYIPGYWEPANSGAGQNRSARTSNGGYYKTQSMGYGTVTISAPDAYTDRVTGDVYSFETNDGKDEYKDLPINSGETLSGKDFKAVGYFSIKVKVRLSNNNGVSGVPVEVLDSSNNSVKTEYTDYSGNVTIRLTRQGRYTVRPSSPPGKEYTFQRTSEEANLNLSNKDDSFTFTATALPPTFTISGKVSYEGINTPVAGVTLHLSASGKNENTTTAGDGTYRFSKVPTGPFTVTLVADPSKGISSPKDVPGTVDYYNLEHWDFTVKPGGAPTITIDQPTDGSTLPYNQKLTAVSGTVTAGAGLKITDLTVRLRRQPMNSQSPEDTKYWGLSPSSITPGWVTNVAYLAPTFEHSLPIQQTGWSINFTLLPPSGSFDWRYKYFIDVTAKDSLGRDADPNPKTASFTVAKPVLKKFIIDGKVTMQVDSQTSRGVAGITLTLTGKTDSFPTLPGENKTQTTTTKSDGTYRFEDVSAGTYTLTPTLTAGTYQPGAQTFALTINKTFNVNIPMERPKVRIFAPRDGIILKSGQGLEAISGDATAGQGHKIRTISVYLVRQLKDSSVREYWGYPTGATTPDWMSDTAAGRLTLTTINKINQTVPNQQVGWGVPTVARPPGAKLSSAYQYYVAATATDDRDLEPENGREGDKFTRSFFTVAEPVFEFKFLDQGLTSSHTARACAGGVADDGVHSARIFLKVTKDGLPWSGPLKFEFQGDKSHNNNLAKLAMLRQTDDPSSTFSRTLPAPNHTLPVTDRAGYLRLTLLSCDVICQPKLIVYKQDTKGLWQQVSTLNCDFAAAQTIRRFPNWTDPNEPKDTGWLFDSPHFDTAGRTTPAKVYLKFKVDPDKGDVDGNWKFVNGHSLKLRIDSVDMRTGSAYSGSLKDYAIFVDPNNPVAVFRLASTGAVLNDKKVADGAAQTLVKAGTKIGDAKIVWLAAQDLTQWTR